MAVTQYQSGGVSLEGCLLIILLAADFFIPMRQLGSFFHIAMNGMAASDKIFAILDIPETKISQNSGDKAEGQKKECELSIKGRKLTCFRSYKRCKPGRNNR